MFHTPRAYVGYVIVLLLIIGTAMHPMPLRAQSIGNTDPFDVTVNPQYPAPYQTVSITPSSSSFDIAASTISVTVNGTSLYKGSGGDDIPVSVGGPGSATTIKVTAVQGGQSYAKTVVIRPASVAIVTEAESTTHPFYQGGALVGSEGGVRLVAIPDLRTSAGTRISPSSLIYTWKLGDQILQSDSGIGKNVLQATAPQRYRDAAISVTVSNQDQTLVAQNSTTVAAVDPVTLAYEDDPLLGPNFDVALQGQVTMTDTEDTYIGVPYYFSANPAVAWAMNGAQGSTGSDITVRSSGSGQGTAVLSFTATDNSSSQTANSTLSVIFGTKPKGIFGL